MLKSHLATIFTLLVTNILFAQGKTTGVVVDKHTKESLPYATIRIGNTLDGTISDLNGFFSITVPTGADSLHVSYAGYVTKTISKTFADTILLSKAHGSLEEVVIRPPYEKIKRIVNLAIENKQKQNPDKLDVYKCHVYYKMNADMLPSAKYKASDSAKEEFEKFINQQHILFGETYSKRSYRKTDKLQETILASRLSGIQKTYFTNLVTSLLPFHVYKDVIMLNGVNYTHPIANGWYGKYEFNLENELLNDGDTTFILSYHPKKGVHFNSLRGIVYINSNGYAISHITTNSVDSNHEMYMKMEQNYTRVDGRWFPAELNYDFIFKKYPSEQIGLRLSGHSIVDSVSFDEKELDKFSKAYPVKLHDSVDLRTSEDWGKIRRDTLSSKEQSTYVFMDSLSGEVGLDRIMQTFTYASVTGRIPVKFLDIDLGKVLSYNVYEKTRLGLGLYTNDKITKYASVGGWFGYGLGDKQWKYGASARLFPSGKKEHWVDIAYLNTYQNTGNVNIHRELDKQYYRNLLLDKVDRVEEYKLTLHGRLGYLEGDVLFKQQTLSPQYSYTMGSIEMLNHKYDIKEVGINLRYAYKERRTPILGYYFPVSSTYPILYVNINGGEASSVGYSVGYTRVVAAASYKTHISRWGKDIYRVEAGIINTNQKIPLPRSLLLAANGFRLSKGFWYAYGGFVTMYPYAFFNDKYASLLYRHDFERMLYKNKFSAPYISIAHNLQYGSLNSENSIANGNLGTPAVGYHETGLMLNRLLRINYFNLAYLDLNVAAFYHWNGDFNWRNNGVVLLGFGLGF